MENIDFAKLLFVVVFFPKLLFFSFLCFFMFVIVFFCFLFFLCLFLPFFLSFSGACTLVSALW